MIRVGDKVRWREDYARGKDNPPMLVLDTTAMVKVEGGSHITARMLEVVEAAPGGGGDGGGDTAGLLAVIEAQLDAIQDLQDAAAAGGKEDADTTADLLQALCLALVGNRLPQGSTGIMELDALIEHMFPS